MKNICPICSKNKSNRVCEIKNNNIICSLCCVAIRNDFCMDCSYYESFKKYEANKNKVNEQKLQKQKTPHFIKRIDSEVDDKVNIALELAEKGSVREAEKKLRALLLKNPDIDTIYYGLGTIYAFQEKHDEALKYFDQAIKIFPYFTEVWFNKGMVHKTQLDIEKMIEAFQKVVEFGDSNDSFVIEAKEIIDGISQQIRESSNISLDEFLFLSKIFKEGFKYMNKKEWEKAIEKFNEVIRKDYRHVQSYGNIGICYANIGEMQKAIQALDKAIELDPEYKPAILNKKIFLSLPEGAKLNDTKMSSVEFYTLMDKTI